MLTIFIRLPPARERARELANQALVDIGFLLKGSGATVLFYGVGCLRASGCEQPTVTSTIDMPPHASPSVQNNLHDYLQNVVNWQDAPAALLLGPGLRQEYGSWA